MNDNELIRKCAPQRRKDIHKAGAPDRHKPGAPDRHKPGAPDRHKPSAKRMEDRHKPSAKRNQDRHKIINDLHSDTGMDVVCCCCFQMKSRKSCVSSATLPTETLLKYAVDNEYTRTNDAILYICTTCSNSIKSGKEPVRSQKELLGYLDFPPSFKNTLQKFVCQ